MFVATLDSAALFGSPEEESCCFVYSNFKNKEQDGVEIPLFTQLVHWETLYLWYIQRNYICNKFRGGIDVAGMESYFNCLLRKSQMPLSVTSWIYDFLKLI